MVDKASWNGGGITSGILGLAYPILTSAFTNTSKPAEHELGSQGHRPYDPIFTTMHKQGLTTPTFSVAVDPHNGTGWLAFGGLPPVDHDPEFAKTPIKKVRIAFIGSETAGR
jgi:hypothetical protein